MAKDRTKSRSKTTSSTTTATSAETESNNTSESTNTSTTTTNTTESLMTEANTDTTNTEAAAAVEAPKLDERYKLLKHPTTGQQVKRIDLIRELWDGGKSRSEITKIITDLSGKKVPYQVIFSATKGRPGGPPKAVQAEGAPAAEAPAAAETSAE